MTSEINIRDTTSEQDNGGDDTEEQSVSTLTVDGTSEGPSTIVKHVETNLLRSNNKKVFMSNVKNDIIEENLNATLPSDVNCTSNHNGLHQAEVSYETEVINNPNNSETLNSVEQPNASFELKCNKEDAALNTAVTTLAPVCGEIENGISASNRLGDKSLLLFHENLRRKKCYFDSAENEIAEVAILSGQLPLSSRNMIRKKQFFSKDLQSNNTESPYEERIGDRHNNNHDNVFNTNQDSMKDACNLPLESIASCSSDEQSQFQCTSINKAHNSDIVNAHTSLNFMENNNKNTSEDLNRLSEDGSSHISKNVPKAQNTLANIMCCNEITRKPFKLPILENISETASAQQTELEENAVALLEPPSIRNDHLDEAQGIEIEPRSSNSSDASNSDTESQQAVLGRTGTKKVQLL